MILNDIDSMKQKLYAAMDDGDKNIAYSLSVELDCLIVQFYKLQTVQII